MSAGPIVPPRYPGGSRRLISKAATAVSASAKAPRRSQPLLASPPDDFETDLILQRRKVVVQLHGVRRGVGRAVRIRQLTQRRVRTAVAPSPKDRPTSMHSATMYVATSGGLGVIRRWSSTHLPVRESQDLRRGGGDCRAVARDDDGSAWCAAASRRSSTRVSVVLSSSPVGSSARRTVGALANATARAARASSPRRTVHLDMPPRHDSIGQGNSAGRDHGRTATSANGPAPRSACR